MFGDNHVRYNGRQRMARAQMMSQAAKETAQEEQHGGDSTKREEEAKNNNVNPLSGTGMSVDLGAAVYPLPRAGMSASDRNDEQEDDNSATSSMVGGGLDELDDQYDEEVLYQPARPHSSGPVDEEGFKEINVAALDLLTLCQEVCTPLYVYDEIIGILKRHSKKGTLQIHTLPSREKLMRKLRGTIKTPRLMPCTVHTSMGYDVAIAKFKFLDQLKDLLSSQYFNDIQNLCANPSVAERFDMYKKTPEDDMLEVCTGEWYRTTYEELSVSRTRTVFDGRECVKQLLVPLIFYVDKTGTDILQRYPLEPLMFTTPLLRRDIRRKSDAWRHVGFVPSETMRAPESSSSRSAADKLQGYHECLREMVLKELVELQHNPPCIEVNLGGVKRLVVVRLPIAFIVGDQESQDALCCRRKPAGRAPAIRLHRQCMCSQLTYIESGSIYGQRKGCTSIPLSLIKQYVFAATTNIPEMMERVRTVVSQECKDKQVIDYEVEKQQQLLERRVGLATKILEFVLGIYPVRNAFDDVSFGSNKHGIYAATLNDTMHFNEGGLILNMAQVAYGIVGSSDRRAGTLEKAISTIFSNSRSSVRSTFPRGFYRPGFTDLTLLTSNEKVGVLFALVVVLRMNASLREEVYKKMIEESQRKYMTFNLTPEDAVKLQELQERQSQGSNQPIFNIFPTTSVQPFLRDKGKNQRKRMQYQASAECFEFVSLHLKLHDLGEILNVELDALQLHYLMRECWDVLEGSCVSKEDSYPNVRIEIRSLENDDEETMFDETIGLYCFIPLHEIDQSPNSCWFNQFGLDVLVGQLTRFDDQNILEEKLETSYCVSTSTSSDDDDDSRTTKRMNKNRKKNRTRKRQRVSSGSHISSGEDIVEYTQQRKNNNDSRGVQLPSLIRAESLKVCEPLSSSSRRRKQKNTRYFISKHRREKSKKPTVSAAVLTDVETFLHVLELTLLHHAYLHYSETIPLEHRRDIPTIEQGIENYLSLVDRSVYRGDNTMDLGTCKFHCHYQTCATIPMFGDPSQHEAGSCERGLQYWAKKVSRTAQKNRDVQVFSFQTASRVEDAMLLAKAQEYLLSRKKQQQEGEDEREDDRWINKWHQFISLPPDDDSSSSTITTSSTSEDHDDRGVTMNTTNKETEDEKNGNYFFARNRPHYYLDVVEDTLTALNRFGKKTKKTPYTSENCDIQLQIIRAVINKERQACCELGLEVRDLNIWTEIKDDQGNHLRASPEYSGGGGAWYDWAFVHFEDDDGNSRFLPAKCVLFYLDVRNIPSALVHGCSWLPVSRGSIGSSLLCDEWKKEYVSGFAALTKVPISAIQQGALAFETRLPYPKSDIPLISKKLKPEDVELEHVVVMYPRSSWAMRFYTECTKRR